MQTLADDVQRRALLATGPDGTRRHRTAPDGLGMALGSQQRRERLVADVRELLEEVRGDVFFYFLG